MHKNILSIVSLLVLGVACDMDQNTGVPEAVVEGTTAPTPALAMVEAATGTQAAASFAVADQFIHTIDEAEHAATTTSAAELTIVFVLDGLRPDSINEVDTPHLFALRETGVDFINSHAAFPTVTRVNSPAISTGTYPGTNGIVSNSMYVPEVDPTGQFSTGDYHNLQKLDEASGGRLLFVESLAQRLQRAGKTLVAVSSGSTGSAYLLNHRAQDGVGVLINGYLEPEPEPVVAIPEEVNAEVLARFGVAPPTNGADGLFAPTDWAEEVMREYVIPDLRPDVILNWITQPDGSQHAEGVGSENALATIRNDDRNIGLILDKLEELDLADKTNIFVTSDHGFGVHTFGVNLNQELVDAGLKEAVDSTDVVVASSSHAAFIHVEGHDRHRVAGIAQFLQRQPWAGVVFSPSRHRNAVHGWIPGTFSYDLIHHDNDERQADLILTFEWSSDRNAYGIQGTDTTLTGGLTGAIEGDASGHGSMSPWTVRNTWFVTGPDFKAGIIDRVPSAPVDIAPTILWLAGLDRRGTEGRVIYEALAGGPDQEKVPVETRSFFATGWRTHYQSVIQVTNVGRHRYIDKSWRLH